MSFNSPFEALERREKKLSDRERAVLVQRIYELDMEREISGGFDKIYPEEIIAADREFVAERERAFQARETLATKEGHFYGKILEAIIMEFGNAWIPGFFSLSSKYDDFKNGIDMFLEMEDDQKNIHRLGIDVTSDENRINQKLDSSIDKFKEGYFQNVKYYKSELDEKIGPESVPRLIAGADSKEMLELARLFVGFKTAESRESKARFSRLIFNHRLGGELREMLKDQLNFAIAIMKRLKQTSEINLKIKALEGAAMNLDSSTNKPVEEIKKPVYRNYRQTG